METRFYPPSPTSCLPGRVEGFSRTDWGSTGATSKSAPTSSSQHQYEFSSHRGSRISGRLFPNRTLYILIRVSVRPFVTNIPTASGSPTYRGTSTPAYRCSFSHSAIPPSCRIYVAEILQIDRRTPTNIHSRKSTILRRHDSATN